MVNALGLSLGVPTLGRRGNYHSQAYSDSLQVAMTPTYGAEVLTDPGLEVWASATNLTNYGEVKAGTSSIDQEGTVVHGGSYAAKMTVDGSNSTCNLAPITGNLKQHTWYRFACWSRSDSGAPVIQMGAVAGAQPGFRAFAVDDTYRQYTAVRRTVTNPNWQFGKNAATSLIFYLDDLSISEVSAVFQCPSALNGADKAVSALLTLSNTDRTIQGGVVANLDSVTNPLNFVIGYHDGSQVFLEKCVNGTYTTLIQATVAYAAGTAIEIRKSSTSYELWYNGAQRGTTQTVSDASIINNTIFGRFGTDGGARLDNLTIQPYPFPG